ncbi:MAG: anhydro-N-acetylmuramic acid kinase [Ginsengibacter sp.]
MIYKVIGVMSGSSLDGMDIVFSELHENGGKWNYAIKNTRCVAYDTAWEQKLRDAINLPARDYLLLHADYGRFTGQKINEFIDEEKLHHHVNLISSHGHTTFHLPECKMTHQLGDGAAIAAETKLPVVSDLRAMDVAFGGQGAPIVPLGEKLLFVAYDYFLNIGGIANISVNTENNMIAFDVCAANRVLNMLAGEKELAYDNGGIISSRGSVNEDLLEKLNALAYYQFPHPKSLANSFGVDIIYPLIKSYGLTVEDALRTYTEHICIQITNSLRTFKNEAIQKIFITGGGAFNTFLVERIQQHLEEINFEIFIPSDEVVIYKEALIMALLGALRWREQYTVLASVTGALRNSIGGALWLGTEA